MVNDPSPSFSADAPRKSIKRKLIRLFLIMGLTPAFILMSIMFIGVTRNLERQTGAFLKDWSLDIALRADEHIENKIHLVNQIKKEGNLLEAFLPHADKARLSEMIQNYMTQDDDFFNITLLNPEQRIRLAYPFYLFEPEDLKPWWKQAWSLKPNHLFMVAEVRGDAKTKKRLHIITPVMDRYGIKKLGLIIASFDLNSLIGLIRNIPTTGQDYICLLDQEGSILSDTKNRKQLYNIPSKLIKRMREKDSGWIKEHDELFDTSSVFGFAPIAAFNDYSVPEEFWTIYVSKNRKTFLRPIHFFMLRLFGFCLAVILVMLLIFNVNISTIWKPILALTRGAEKMGAGDFDMQVHVKTDDELETLAQTFTQMGQNLKSSHETLKNQNVRLIELNEAKNKFLSMVSHELRTPLVIIKEALSQVLDGIKGPVAPEQKTFLQMAFRNSGRLTKIVNDLLNISGIETGRMKLSRTRTDLVALLKQEIQNQRIHTDENNIVIREQYDLDHAETYCDRDKIIIVFTNLLGNASKFLPGGGTIDVRLISLPQEFQITVKDNGPGFPAELADKIFDRFFRVTETPLVGSPSAGLGLAIARELLQMQGGEIWAESPPDEGALFTFSLPRYNKAGYLQAYMKDRVQEARDRDLDLSLFHGRLEVFDTFQDKIPADRLKRAFFDLVDLFQNNPLDLLEVIAINEKFEVTTFAFSDIQEAQVIRQKLQEMVEAYLIHANLVDQIFIPVAGASLMTDGKSQEELQQFVQMSFTYVEGLKKRESSMLELLSQNNSDILKDISYLPTTAACLEPLMKSGQLTPEEARHLLQDVSDLPCFNPSGFQPDPAILGLFENTQMQKYRFVPVRFAGNKLAVAMVDPYDLGAIQTLLRKGSFSLERHYLLDSDLKKLLKRFPQKS